MLLISQHNKAAGFTLLELLIVTAILAVLAGFISTAAVSGKRRAYITKSRALIVSLETAISMYESDIGSYPEPEQLVTRLSSQQVINGRTFGPYMEFDSGQTSGENVLDAWGNPFSYSAPGANNTFSFDLSSNGADGVSGTSDDIDNW